MEINKALPDSYEHLFHKAETSSLKSQWKDKCKAEGKAEEMEVENQANDFALFLRSNTDQVHGTLQSTDFLHA